MGSGWYDDHALLSDDQDLKKWGRQQNRIFRQAYEAGLAGGEFDPKDWPGFYGVFEAWECGALERRRQRRDRVIQPAWGAARWVGRQVAPKLAKQMRRRQKARRKARGTGDPWRPSDLIVPVVASVLVIGYIVATLLGL